MKSTGQDPTRWMKLGILIVLGVLVPMLAILQDYAFVQPHKKVPWSWPRAIANELPFWYLWLLLLPPLAHMVRRFPLDARRWWWRLPVYLLATAVFTTVHLALYLALMNPFQTPPQPFREKFLANWGQSMTTYEVFMFAVLVAGIHAHAYAKRYQEEALRASELKSQLVRSQLEALKMQLQPHFLFNTLHAISALMYQDVEAADRMIARLSGLLRASLQSAPRQEVPLREELEFLQGYLEIEQVRLGERLTVNMAIEDECLDATVPNLILQPLVENAIRHGIAPRVQPGHLAVDARRSGDDLEIMIQDDGLGLSRSAFKEGVGLSNVRSRMERLYGPAHRFELRDGESGGLTVTLTLPFKLHEGMRP